MQLRILANGKLLTILWLAVSPVLLLSGSATLNTQLQQAVIVQNGERVMQKIGGQRIVTAPQRATELSSYREQLQEPLNSGVKVAEQPAKLSVSVKNFGAVGNGTADDTRAIQKAIDAVYNAGGGVVFFTPGIYKVTINPSTLQAITIHAKVILKGVDRRNSIIKLADRQGNYNSILAGATPSSDLSDFAMYDLAVDGNGSNNPVIAETDFKPNKLRYALRIYAGSRIHIERCRFTNQNNINTITTNGNTISDVWITYNVFESIGGGTVDYDHSTIYTHGKRIQISNNSFSSRSGAGTKGARTAIEIHGDEHTVNNNKISGYTYGINVTGVAKRSNGQTIINNVIEDVYTGVVVWSYFYGGNTASPALVDCDINNNKIRLNVNAWRSVVLSWGNEPSAGISLQPKSDAPIKNLNIVNNRISFTNFYGSNRISDYLSSGINLRRILNVETENINISGNTIENSLAAGIYISMPIKFGKISGNNIGNFGMSTNPFSNYYRRAILVDGDFKNVQFNDNWIINNYGSQHDKGGHP